MLCEKVTIDKPVFVDAIENFTGLPLHLFASEALQIIDMSLIAILVVWILYLALLSSGPIDAVPAVDNGSDHVHDARTTSSL